MGDMALCNAARENDEDTVVQLTGFGTGLRRRGDSRIALTADHNGRLTGQAQGPAPTYLITGECDR